MNLHNGLRNDQGNPLVPADSDVEATCPDADYSFVVLRSERIHPDNMMWQSSGPGSHFTM